MKPLGYKVWSVSKLSTEAVGSPRELVVNCVHTADATQLDSWSRRRRRCVLDIVINAAVSLCEACSMGRLEIIVNAVLEISIFGR